MHTLARGFGGNSGARAVAWLLAASLAAVGGGAGGHGLDDEAYVAQGIHGPPLEVHAGNTLLVVGTLDGVVHVLSATTGEKLWSFKSGGALIASSFLDTLRAGGADVEQAVQSWPASHWAAGELHATPERASGMLEGGVGEGDLEIEDLADRTQPSAPAARADPPTGEPASPDAPPMLLPSRGRGDEVEARGSSEEEDCAEGGGAPHGAAPDAAVEVDARGAATPTDGGELEGDASDDEGLEVVPGVDGSIYILDGADREFRLTEHTVQELVASPTILGEDGVLLSNKESKVFALNPQTGEPLYVDDKETACLPPDCPIDNASNEHGLLLISRSDYSARVLDPGTGRQRWNVSVGELLLELHPSAASRDSPLSHGALSRRLRLLEDNALCAAASDDAACLWHRGFDSPPAVVYMVNQGSGAHTRLAFQAAAPAQLAQPVDSMEREVLMDLVPEAALTAALPAGGPSPPDGEMALAVKHDEASAARARSLKAMQPLMPLLPMFARHPALAFASHPYALKSSQSRALATPPAVPTAPVDGPSTRDDLSLLADATVRQLLVAVELRLVRNLLAHKLYAALALAAIVSALWLGLRRRRQRRAERERLLREAREAAAAAEAEAERVAAEAAAKAEAEESDSDVEKKEASESPAELVPQLPPSRYRGEFVEGSRLGKGGFGLVFRARHLLDGVEYAVKKVLLTGSERAQDRAVREATCLAKLDHVNVVRYYQVWKEEFHASDLQAEFADSSDDDDFSTTEGEFSSCSQSLTPRSPTGRRDQTRTVLFIQMQLCDRTMREWLQEGGRETTLDSNRPYFVQLLRGLQHIHANSLIHRDLTPNNVFITHDNVFKIGDFGLSREMVTAMPLVASLSTGLEEAPFASPDGRVRADLRSAHRSITRGVGTSLYMSPEQRANRLIDHKVDVYAAGVVFLEMLYTLSTQMERVHVLSDLQRGVLPASMARTQPKIVDFILSLTAPSPNDRPTVDDVLAHPLLSLHGTVRVRAERESMHAVMAKVHALLDEVHRVKSFHVEDDEGLESSVTIDYFVEPQEGAGRNPEPPFEALSATLCDIPGVTHATSFAQLEASPRPSPAAGAGSGSPSVFPAALQLPPTAGSPPGSGGSAQGGEGGRDKDGTAVLVKC